MKRWIRMVPLLWLTALLCAALAAAEFQEPRSLNCHQMAQLLFSGQEEANLLAPDEHDAVEAALSDYFAAREAGYRGDVSLLSADETNMSADVAETNALRTERVQEMETRLNLVVLDADVTLRMDPARTVRNPDGTLTLYAYEWTYFDYDDLSDGYGGMDVSGFGTWHILTVAERPDGSCQILADEYDESDMLGINTLSDEHTRELMERGVEETDFGAAPVETPEEETASLLAFSYYPNYDVSKAVAYSDAYCEHYNPDYANFNPYGGDCANFTSQSIYAGGMPQVPDKPYSNDGWYYKTSTDRSATWTGATNLHNWMAKYRGYLTTASKNTVYTGSPVFYSTQGNGTFQHAVLCVGTNSAGTPIINSHNTNKYHVLWNYYTGSVVIDTVQLTSKTFSSFSGYRNIGTEFHAYLVNPSLNRYITNDGGGAASSRTRTEEAGQVWRFVRQSDGSYQLFSALETDKCLAVQGGDSVSRTPVVTETAKTPTAFTDTSLGSPGQLWYIYWDNSQFAWGQGAYQLRPKCSDRVLDIVEGSDAEGASLWIFTKNDTEAQLFQIYETQWVTLTVPELNVTVIDAKTENVTFSWLPVTGAGSYRLRVMRGDTLAGSATIRGVSYTMTLEPGYYTATLEAVSANERSSEISAEQSITVYHSYNVDFDANGGEMGENTELTRHVKREEVDLILPEETPTRTGYTFASWNDDELGTGNIYLPGAAYDKDEDVTLYAQWTPNTYTIKLDPNYRNYIPLEQDEFPVVYDRRYGALPTPTRVDYSFDGWYTDSEEGELVTADTIVRVAGDHTLYAKWNYSVPYTTSDVRSSGDGYEINATPHQISRGTMMVCGYYNDQFVSVDSKKVGEEGNLRLSGDINRVRVFVFDDSDGMRPLCEPEVIASRDFR